VGFNERRGDTLELINMPFAAPDGFAAGGAVAGGAETGMFDLSRAEILRITELAILFIVAILVILLVARPLIGAIVRAATMRVVGPGTAALPESGSMPAALAAPAAGTALAVAAGAAQNPANQIDLDSIDGRMGASSMKKIGEIVDKHPDETVAILRNWIYQEAG
jgi:flagellar M-ring protein FliF